MPYSYFVHNELRLVVSTASDCVSWSEIKACQDQTRTDPEFDQIVDLRSATRVELSGDQMRFLAGRRIFSPRSRRAFIAPNPSVFGMGRMWEAYTEFSQNQTEIRVFGDLPAALEWLGLKELPVSITEKRLQF
jgi:hypothetical protein